MIVPLDQIPNSTGYLVLSLEGAVLNSGGELENAEDTAKKIYDVLTNSSRLVSAVASGETIQSVSLNYGPYSYVVARSNKKIHVVKKRSDPSKSPQSSFTSSQSPYKSQITSEMSEKEDTKADSPPEDLDPPKKYEECEDPELEDLLQSTLQDFESKPVLGASGSSEKEDGAGWDEESFIKDATGHFEQSMRALLAASSGVAGEPGVAEAEMSKVFEEIFKGLPQPPPAPASTHRPDGTVDPMEDVLQMMSRMQGLQAAGVGGGGEPANETAEGGASAFLPLMSGLLKQVLSKDVLYPALKSMLDRFPQYMNENRDKLKPEDVKRYEEQQRLMKQVCDEFDSSNADFEKVFNLMQEMQTHGHPPKEVIDGAENPADLSALGLDPSLFSPGQPECSIS